MELIDAFWEKRNLGVDCTEITISNEDTVSQLEAITDLLDTIEYIVVKVPIARLDINEYLTKHDFVFIEANVNFQLNIKDAILTPLQQRLNNSIAYAEMNASDLSLLYVEIEKGLFKTDRILLDHNFTKLQAATRYINWIKDELARTAKAYKIVYKEDTIGFFTFKQIAEDVYYPFLAGLYEKYSQSGLGFTTLRKPIEEVIKRKGKLISTYASTNNPYVIRAHTQQGFSIHDMQYVYVKHNF
jgi:hypothetical protein